MTHFRTILLAEDNTNDVELTLAGLKSQPLDATITVVRDGEEALDFLHRRGNFTDRPPGNPALILLDLKMPKIDGLEVLHTIKSDPQFRLIPVVILTSSREQPDVRACFESGANAYVVKPVDFKEYSAAIRAIGTFWMQRNEIPPESVRAPN